MSRTVFIVALGLGIGSAAAHAESNWRTARLPDAEVSVRLERDKSRIEGMLGDDLNGEFTLIEVKILSLFDKELEFNRGDFVFRSRSNNESSEAQSPERIAGDSVLTLSQTSWGSGGIFSQDSAAPVIGGVPGTGSRPRRLGTTPNTVGNAGSTQSETSVKAEQGKADDSLLGRLKRYELPLKTNLRAEGYLYFQVDPTRKLKHYVLTYDGPYGEFRVAFDD